MDLPQKPSTVPDTGIAAKSEPLAFSTTTPAANPSKVLPQKPSPASKYDDTEALFQKFDEVLNNNLRLLDESFNSSLNILDHLIVSNGVIEEVKEKKETTNDEEKNGDTEKVGDGGEATKDEDKMDIDVTPTTPPKPRPLLHEKFVEELANEKFRKTITKHSRDSFMKTYWLGCAINNPDPSKNVQGKVSDLENKSIPEIQKTLEKELAGYYVNIYQADLDYRMKILPNLNDVGPNPSSDETIRFGDVKLYEDFKLSAEDINGLKSKTKKQENKPDVNKENKMDIDEQDHEAVDEGEKEKKAADEIIESDLEFLDLKLLKSKKYIEYVNDLKLIKLKNRLINEVLTIEKIKLDKESQKWLTRKNDLMKFLNVDLKNVAVAIKTINEEIREAKEAESEEVSGSILKENRCSSVEKTDIGTGDVIMSS
ncbi:hypothetical protein DASC09_002840 [Saccharomycopsis crataegensis]|uniref:Uncharacterized protein n=1 Tax=Saccharomycopsis crataegensis TaxID=43959 RepID=A0AAV5QE49_9ASCO|nr:hypothetical protein DASC09_002840 [Saccharomycopsis crataegensis]